MRLWSILVPDVTVASLTPGDVMTSTLVLVETAVSISYPQLCCWRIMSDPFIGEIAFFAFNFAPRGWALCDGQLMPIAQNTALFSLLGTMYGGDGPTNFALPDLRGRVPMHQGQGPGAMHEIGESSGEEGHTLTADELPAHTHRIGASSTKTSSAPGGHLVAKGGAYGTAVDTHLASPSKVGKGLAHNNLQPYLVGTWCIAVPGIFPSRD